MAILLFELILADEVSDLLADLPHPPLDLPMDLNGNFYSVELILADEVVRSTGRSTPPPVDLPMDLN